LTAGYPATSKIAFACSLMKLEEDPSTPRHILTVRKAGYRLAR
jgi:hypothetical protein